MARAPSRFTRRPVLAWLGNVSRAPRNRKIGNMAQLWIEPEAEPLTDRTSACGSCPLQGHACYVDKRQAVMVHRAARGCVVERPPELHKPLRLGADGDPVALSLPFVRELVRKAPGHTGYTHSWRRAPAGFRELVMASVDSPAQRREANAKGWRTFRIMLPEEDIEPGEILCPASKPRSSATCSRCLLCNGGSGPDIAVRFHGSPVGDPLGRFRAYRESIDV